ncbi:hypothetical protein V493_02096 [Pseudogymnoascus sp. VKM F-4281 (FW-2241)]|nr:hypothetical protein V493_02096 [Pseudogymnoascus sp. VKM F-4281 (FW-2241)]
MGVLEPRHRRILRHGVYETRLTRHRDMVILVNSVSPVAIADHDAVVDGLDAQDLAGEVDAAGGLEAGEGRGRCEQSSGKNGGELHG